MFKNLGIFFVYFVIFVVQLLIPRIKDILRRVLETRPANFAFSLPTAEG